MKLLIVGLIFHLFNGGDTLPGSNHLPSLIYGKTSDPLFIADEVVDFFIKN